MNLSKAYEIYRVDKPMTFACCVHCKKAWVDDKEQYGSLCCPECGPEVGALYRGAKDPSEYGCVLDTSDEVPRFDVVCATCKTPYSRLYETFYPEGHCPACGCEMYIRKEDYEEKEK